MKKNVTEVVIRLVKKNLTIKSKWSDLNVKYLHFKAHDIFHDDSWRIWSDSNTQITNNALFPSHYIKGIFATKSLDLAIGLSKEGLIFVSKISDFKISFFFLNRGSHR